MQSTEFIGFDGQGYLGPDLPLALASHCVIKINPNTVLLAGGATSPYSTTSKTYFFDIPSGTWTEGPAMNKRRKQHSCAILEDINYVFVLGGRGDDSFSELASVEVLSLKSFPNQLSWIEPENLMIPKPLASFGAISLTKYQTFNRLYVFGGINPGITEYSEDIYELICTGWEIQDCSWQILDQKLALPRGGMVVLPITEDSINCKR